jgi:DNA-binding NarL/FixJ family response regulator
MWQRRDTIDLGPWPYLQRPRVLIEHPDPDEALEFAIAIRDAGCTVGICRGPDATADKATRCPLHQLEPCIAVEGADVVVSALDLSGQDGRDVVEGLRTRYRDTQTIVLATVGQTLELGDILDDCTVLPVDAAPEHVAAAVRTLIRDTASTPIARR